MNEGRVFEKILPQVIIKWDEDLILHALFTLNESFNVPEYIYLISRMEVDNCGIFLDFSPNTANPLRRR